MTELNYAFISENGKEVDKTLDWSYIDWHEKKTVKGTDAQTQTQCVQSEDKDTQTASPFIMRIDLGRTPSRLRYGSLTESDSMPAHLFQFDRQAPARISTSPTLRRMRSTRISYRDPSKSDGPLGEEIFPLLSKKACLILLQTPEVVVHNKTSSKPSDETPFTTVSNHQIMEGSLQDQLYKREAPFTPFTHSSKPFHNRVRYQ
uniref:Uncharacterized protein n=1 Tax=Sinocyclocheilus anshuiensis TaxID=1608454 RepID=A0A671L148_9TELE